MACLFSSTSHTQTSGSDYYQYSVATSVTSPQQPYCLPSQRFDVRAFPPHCFDCPRVIPNRMLIMRIDTTLMLSNSTKRPVQKFSPGLPQNQTCGCWTAPANQTFDIVLNTSWIVTGLVFSSERARWLKEFEVQASNDSKTFMPWGTFTMSNFTAASLALFSYPIHARYFRINVRKYANHYPNSSTGFPLTPVQALVSTDQPFSCACPMLSSGACCPFINMTVREDKCVWCMEPSDIGTRMIEGCGKCKPGTFEHAGKCYQRIRSRQHPVANSVSIGSPSSNGVHWSVDVNFTVDMQSVVQLFVTRKPGRMHPCMSDAVGWAGNSKPVSSCCIQEYHNDSGAYIPILWNFTPPPTDEGATITSPCSIHSRLDPPNSAKQFVQFDRGREKTQLNRYTLSFTESEIRRWATCNDETLVCIGSIGALFATATNTTPFQSFLPQLHLQPLQFEMGVPPLVCATQRDLPNLARAELHYYAMADIYTVRILGVVLKGDMVKFQWGNAGYYYNDSIWQETNNTASELAISPPPQDPLSILRITDSMTTIRIEPPIKPVVHDAMHRSTHAGIMVELLHGFGFSAVPSPGDTDQIITVTAKSTHPMRLKRLVTVSQNGQFIVYTNPKGFISDSKRVVDLGVACYQDTTPLAAWLLQALQLLDTEGLPYEDFVQRSCEMVFTGEVAKAFWLVPHRGIITADSRTAPAGVDVIVEFA
jgi:hypothetical protein